MKKIIKFFALPLSLAIVPGLSMQTAQATVKPTNLAADTGSSQDTDSGYGGHASDNKGGWGSKDDWKDKKSDDWKGGGKGDWGGYGGKNDHWKDKHDGDWKGGGKGDWGGYGDKGDHWKDKDKGDWGGYNDHWKDKHGKHCKFIEEKKWVCQKVINKKCFWDDGKYVCKDYCKGEHGDNFCPKKCGWYPVQYKVCKW